MMILPVERPKVFLRISEFSIPLAKAEPMLLAIAFGLADELAHALGFNAFLDISHDVLHGETISDCFVPNISFYPKRDNLIQRDTVIVSFGTQAILVQTWDEMIHDIGPTFDYDDPSIIHNLTNAIRPRLCLEPQ